MNLENLPNRRRMGRENLHRILTTANQMNTLTFTNSQLRKLCTGKPTPSRGYHPSHRCKDIYLITPTGGPVCFYAENPEGLKIRKAWHKEAMSEWMADPHKRRALVREVCENLCESREAAIAASTVTRTARYIEHGRLFFVSRLRRNDGVTISQL